MIDTNFNPALLGQVSTGTLDTAELLNAFSDELCSLLRNNEAYLSLPASTYDRKILYALRRRIIEAFENAEHIDREEANDLVDEAVDALGFFSPQNAYFGTYPDDETNFGYWLFDEQTAE